MIAQRLVCLPQTGVVSALSNDDGQNGSTVHSSHKARRALHTRRPCAMSRCEKKIQSRRGTSSIKSRSIFSGCPCAVNPSLCESRATCVSTTMPAVMPKALPSTTLAVLRATPGSSSNSSSFGGTRPSYRSMIIRHEPLNRSRLVAKEPCRANIRLKLARLSVRVIFRPAVLAKETRQSQG